MLVVDISLKHLTYMMQTSYVKQENTEMTEK